MTITAAPPTTNTGSTVATDENSKIVDARIDAAGRYCDNARELIRQAMTTEINDGCNHIAFRVRP